MSVFPTSRAASWSAPASTGARDSSRTSCSSKSGAITPAEQARAASDTLALSTLDRSALSPRRPPRAGGGPATSAGERERAWASMTFSSLKTASAQLPTTPSKTASELRTSVSKSSAACSAAAPALPPKRPEVALAPTASPSASMTSAAEVGAPLLRAGSAFASSPSTSAVDSPSAPAGRSSARLASAMSPPMPPAPAAPARLNREETRLERARDAPVACPMRDARDVAPVVIR